ncbi:collagen-like protein, partial [Tenacibaculum finnmarkense]|nr:collagen-like protein [Tenacibaculum finnmarkense]MCG8742719.1 collagen-like protein [Tenacibaculum finnmarkense]MCG8766132.1 collagen-like protein [Tenacibaculum finnmarkense]MCG8779079.1 collagen-like protein [Tenacibaculum finnmarkense]MCM8907625.1 collagen-like protein [Tenacibaculum finnmarkense genomovar finnmarkense]
MSRKVETTHLQVKSVKNAKVLGTNKDGFVIESDLDFLNYIPKDGAKGADGLKGAKGDTGVKGADGLKGTKGDTGAKGADGLKGAKGDTGAKGADGLKGVKGDTGAKGADGLKGTKGDTGAKGSDAKSIDVQAGTNITIDKTNPLKPVINSSLPAEFYEE